MIRPAFLLILALLIHSCFSLSNPFNHEPPPSYSSNSLLQYTSQIIIRKDTPSGEPIYTIQADFGKLSDSDYSDMPQTVQTNNFLLSLYTSHNILGGTCQDFEPSTCESTYGCQSIPENTVNITLPYTSIIGSTGQTGFYFDYLSYFNKQTPFVFPQNCVGGMIGGIDTEQAVAGMIGMGINGNARKSFQREFPMFSIYLASNGAYGQVVFGLDQNIVDDSISPLSFPASEDWEISLENSELVLGNNSIEFSGTAIFDLNLNSIGLPSVIYDNVISWLSSEYGVNCTGNLCKSETYYRLLPALVISTQYSNLSILPTTYMSQNGGSMYTLRLSRIVTNNSTTQEENFVRVNAGYENYIILGAPVMMSYYVTFQKHSNGPAIHMFKTTTKNNFMWVIIVGGIAICAIMLILVIFGIAIKKTGSRTAPERRRYLQQPEQYQEAELAYTRVVNETL